MNGVSLRLLRPSDSFAELTDLLHRAFAPLAARGLRYWGSFQNEADTRGRCGRGECWVAEADGKLVGTVTWRHDPREDEPGLYHRRDVAVFGQLAVDPGLQRQGIGDRLLATAEERAKAAGFAEMVCDTAAPNEPLIAYYARRGYREVGRHQWSDTNYESVLLGKQLRVTPPREARPRSPSA